ncbi:MAG: hypothetical protein MUE59_09580 [Thiobacillaceae bacterium]|jgi:hypothetical protein|nr:hypothetical protein [Thiobacillaceae bacterium]
MGATKEYATPACRVEFPIPLRCLSDGRNKKPALATQQTVRIFDGDNFLNIMVGQSNSCLQRTTQGICVILWSVDFFAVAEL